MIVVLTNCSFGLGRTVANVRSSVTLMLDTVSSIIVRWAFSTLTLVCGGIDLCLRVGIAQCIYVLEVMVDLQVIDALIAAFNRPMSRCMYECPLSLPLQHFVK